MKKKSLFQKIKKSSWNKPIFKLREANDFLNLAFWFILIFGTIAIGVVIVLIYFIKYK